MRHGPSAHKRTKKWGQMLRICEKGASALPTLRDSFRMVGQSEVIRFIRHAARKKLWLQRSDLNRELSEKNRGIRIHLPQGGTTVSNTVALRSATVAQTVIFI